MSTALRSFVLPAAYSYANLQDSADIRREAITLSQRLRQADQPSDPDSQYVEGFHIPTFLTFITARTKAPIDAMTPNYRLDSSKTAKRSYWMNHCKHCGVEQGDFWIRQKYDRPAFFMDEHILDDFVLYRADGPFLASSQSSRDAGVLD